MSVSNYNDRIWAFSLTGLLLAGLWLIGGHTYLNRKALTVRTLALKDGFTIGSYTALSVESVDKPETMSSTRRLITLERPGYSADEPWVARRTPVGHSRLVPVDYNEQSEQSTPRPYGYEPVHQRQESRLTLMPTELPGYSPMQRPAERAQAGLRAAAERRATPQPMQVTARDALPKESIEIDEIIEWMRLAPAELPPGIKQHISNGPDDLTAKADFEYNGVEWEIYIQVRIPLRELHTVMVQGDKTWYLIDRSFQRKGRRFRVGYARRQSGMITGVVSEERPAASREAVGVYQVFLAWWDQQRLRLP